MNLFNKLTHKHSLESMEHSICKELEKQGLQHEKHNGHLYVINDKHYFRIQLIDSVNRNVKHLKIFYEFWDDNFKKVTSDGWNQAANFINLNNTSTVFVALSDHFCCCYQSAISTPKEFLDEFNRAYWSIGSALDEYWKIYPCLERDYPNGLTGNNSIGFKQK